MIRLATRLTAGGGRESLIRLVLTGAGLALAVTMLLSAAVAFPALHAHDVRRAWTETSAQNQQPAQDESTTDPLLWRLTEDRFDGDDLLRVDVAAEGPNAPVPPGLQRLPSPGEIAVSPRLAELLESTDAAMLADRFPGRVTATVGRAALASPDDLVVVVGRSPSDLRAEPGEITVRSIESAPISHDLEDSRIALVVGGIGLLVPVVVFVATATRLAAARREQRLAALRLAGATTGQVGTVATVEAAIAAIGGVTVGFGAFLAIRPWLARIPFDGASFYPSDLHLSLAWAAAIALGVPALAVGAAMASLRRIRISPLGVARRAKQSPATPRPLLLVVAGMVALALAVAWANDPAAPDIAIAYVVGGAFLAMIVGVVLSGPWLTSVVGRGISRLGRRAPSLLAARRLQNNPAAGFRAISGIILAVFIGTVFSGLASSALASGDIDGASLAPGVVAAASQFEQPTGPLPEPGTDSEPPRLSRLEIAPDRTAQLVRELNAIPGVGGVVTAHGLPDDPNLSGPVDSSGPDQYGSIDSLAQAADDSVLVSCADAAALGFEQCDGTRVLRLGSDIPSVGVIPPQAFPVDALDDLSVVAVAAITDGQVATIEQARTRLELGVPGSPAMTSQDIDDQNMREIHTVQRMSNIGLSVTLVIAGCSLAVAVAGAIVERKQPFALLRLAGTRLSELRRVVLAEAAAPLLMVATASVGLGLVVAYLVLAASGANQTFVMPGPGYWLALVGGIGVALLVVLATLPLLDRLTALDSVRFE